MARSFRISVLSVLTILLAAPWSIAAPRQDRQPVPQVLWHELAALWNDIGCIIDPNGGCGG